MTGMSLRQENTRRRLLADHGIAVCKPQMKWDLLLRVSKQQALFAGKALSSTRGLLMPMEQGTHMSSGQKKRR